MQVYCQNVIWNIAEKKIPLLLCNSIILSLACYQNAFAPKSCLNQFSSSIRPMERQFEHLFYTQCISLIYCTSFSVMAEILKPIASNKNDDLKKSILQTRTYFQIKKASNRTHKKTPTTNQKIIPNNVCVIRISI